MFTIFNEIDNCKFKFNVYIYIQVAKIIFTPKKLSLNSIECLLKKSELQHYYHKSLTDNNICNKYFIFCSNCVNKQYF